MEPHAEVLQRLFTSLNRHDHEAMTTCYHPEATFRDIAFDLRGRDQIGAMWRMICGGDIRATFEVKEINGASAVVKLVDEYTFSDTGRHVRNVIESRFRIQNGLIVDQQDACDAKVWAAMAIGGIGGFLAGRLRFLRSLKANRKLAKFIRQSNG